MNSFKCVRAFQIELDRIWKCWFLRRGKTGEPEKNLSEQGREPTTKGDGLLTTNQELNPHMASTPGFEPGPHCWEASALTTAPPLPPADSLVASLKTKMGNKRP